MRGSKGKEGRDERRWWAEEGSGVGSQPLQTSMLEEGKVIGSRVAENEAETRDRKTRRRRTSVSALMGGRAKGEVKR
jgi:hypothetical protein